MASEKYLAYLCSREWGLLREAVIERSGGTCERCRDNPGVAVHHKTYARVYRERLTDLIHFCQECHDYTHGRGHVDPTAVVEPQYDGCLVFGALLKFSHISGFLVGQDQISEGTRMLVYMPNLKYGWVKWKHQQPVNYIIGLVGDGFHPPKREELDDLNKNEWEEHNGMLIDPYRITFFVTMCNEYGDLFTFVTASKGGTSAVGSLAFSYGKRRREHPDQIPIIKLKSFRNMHEEYGEMLVPKFVVEGWTKIPETFEDLIKGIK